MCNSGLIVLTIYIIIMVMKSAIGDISGVAFSAVPGYRAEFFFKSRRVAIHLRFA